MRRSPVRSRFATDAIPPNHNSITRLSHRMQSWRIFDLQLLSFESVGRKNQRRSKRLKLCFQNRWSIRQAQCMHRIHESWSYRMKVSNFASRLVVATMTLGFVSLPALAQVPDGPQVSPPPPAHAATTVPSPPTAPGPRIIVPAGTRFAVVLENGISTRGAKPGDSVYFHTSFPITQDNKVVIPIGCYLRGELIESKRPGRVKGRGEFRMKLNTMIFPNGYTVDLN